MISAWLAPMLAGSVGATGADQTGDLAKQARADLESMLINWEKLNPKTHVPNQNTHRLRFDKLQDDMIGKGCRGDGTVQLATDCTGITETGTTYVRVRKKATDTKCIQYDLTVKVE